jgi:hypothetical protein
MAKHAPAVIKEPQSGLERGSTGMVRLRSEFDTYGGMPALFAEVFEEMGGKQFLKEWAQDNPGGFIRLISGMRPSLQPISAIQGEVKIIINNNLGRTELDIGGSVVE